MIQWKEPWIRSQKLWWSPCLAPVTLVWLWIKSRFASPGLILQEIQGGGLDQSILKGTSSSDIFCFLRGAPLQKDCKFFGQGRPSAAGVLECPALKGGGGVVGDRSTHPVTFQEKADDALGGRGLRRGWRDCRLLIACLLCAPFFISLHRELLGLKHHPGSGGEGTRWQPVLLLPQTKIWGWAVKTCRKILLTPQALGEHYFFLMMGRDLGFFYENVHVNRKNRLESSGVEPSLLWRIGFLSCHKYQWKGKQVVNPGFPDTNILTES